MSLLGIRESVGKAVPWRFTCVLMQQNTFENKIHTCYEIKQLNVKTCFCVFKVLQGPKRVLAFSNKTRYTRVLSKHRCLRLKHQCFVKTLTRVFKV